MILNSLKVTLEKNNYECTIIPAGKELPTDQLVIYLGIDGKNREQIASVTTSQIEFPKELKSKEKLVPHHLHFRVKLPFKIEDLALNQVGSLILFINQFLDLPGFELNELEGVVTYRYVWLTYDTKDVEKEQGPLLLSIIGAILLNLKLFSEMIESLAEGKLTFNDLLEQIVEMGKSVSSSTSDA
ncbi:MAG: hypothetical protein Q8K60_09505 [Parachlamydiaceae bacterium]|nr:hypothetical protein [Parachlamydiaceae bacterium]